MITEDGSVEAVVAEETVSEDIMCLDVLVSKQQEKTRKHLRQGAPKYVIKIGDQVWRQNVGAIYCYGTREKNS